MRESGILLPVFSLPSEYGIGTMGKAAFDFIDFLSDSNQRYWQILPLGHTGYGDSPYQCFSAFAGNPYLIDLSVLHDEGFLEDKDLPENDFSEKIDYNKLFLTRIRLIKKAAKKVDVNSEEYINFCTENKFWLEEYSLFMTVKEKKKMLPLKKWEEELRCPDSNTISYIIKNNSENIKIWHGVQYLFYKQWKTLRKYANKKGIEIIGDIPIYVSADSSEMWLKNELFITDDDNEPALFSGCPPDKFSPLGQLWGNPLYDWNIHRKDNYSWWIKRLKFSSELYDVVRIDHFRGFESYYAVDAMASDAVRGEWYKGPSKDFIDVIKMKLPNLRVIAEDLGNYTEDVRRLLLYSGYPGMKVLQFAFDDVCDNEFLPHRYNNNCIAYTGTHDNPTMKQWAAITDDKSFTFAKKYLNVNNNKSFVNDCIRALFASVSNTVIIPMQDWLNLGGFARINVPSIAEGNWTWRVKKGELNENLSEYIGDMTKLYFRNTEEKKQ